MKPRRRFGVSLPEDLAKALDTLAEKLGTDRSKLVEEAVRSLIHDHIHLLQGHYCHGLILIRNQHRSDITTALERYRDIVKAYLHVHHHGECVEVLVVAGPVEKIAWMQKELAEHYGCTTRYIPLE